MMKLKVLPPTLRKNNRYLTLDIRIDSPINKDDLVTIIWEACIRFKGECSTSNFNLWVMKFYEIQKTDEFYHYKAIVRCERDFVDEVRSSLALANNYKGSRIAMTTIGLSGTIKSSQKYI
jgi:ribonuclease P/MRP protein subunit POP5